MITRYREPTKATLTMKGPRDDKEQERFRKCLLKAYGSLSDDGTEAWCPIAATWVPTNFITAAHIVRYNVGEWSAQPLFGTGITPPKEGHIWTPKKRYTHP